MPSYPVPAGTVCEIILDGRLNEQVIQNVFHYLINEDLDDGQAALADNILPSFETVMWAKIRAHMSTDYGSARVLGQFVYPTRRVAQVHIPANRTGTFEPPTVPTGVATVYRRKTFTASRSARGRVYLAGTGTTAITASKMTNAYLGAIAPDIVNAMSSPLEVSPIPFFTYPIIWSNRTPTDLTRYIIAAEVDPIVRYQRRREVGVGV